MSSMQFTTTRDVSPNASPNARLLGFSSSLADADIISERENGQLRISGGCIFETTSVSGRAMCDSLRWSSFGRPVDGIITGANSNLLRLIVVQWYRGGKGFNLSLTPNSEIRLRKTNVYYRLIFARNCCHVSNRGQ